MNSSFRGTQYIVTEFYRYGNCMSGPPVLFYSAIEAYQRAVEIMQEFPSLKASVQCLPEGILEPERCEVCGEVHSWKHSNKE